MQLLLEVVRLAPNAPDPYHTLGNIFQVRGDTRKALDFFMIAAHLPPKVTGASGPKVSRVQGHEIFPILQLPSRAAYVWSAIGGN